MSSRPSPIRVPCVVKVTPALLYIYSLREPYTCDLGVTRFSSNPCNLYNMRKCIHTGEKSAEHVVPADCLLLAGTAIAEEAVLTGESSQEVIN